jgi:very-short-patch-repair endonuclease
MDDERTMYFEEKSCRGLMFWNHEVMENMDGVSQRIMAPPDVGEG